MVAQVIQIGKRRWLAGMNWATYPDMPSRDTLKSDAQRWNSTWLALRTGEHSIQGGFCPALEGESLGQLGGRVNGLFSLAAMLADSRKQPWLGTFKISDDLWWYIAVRDGHAIIPNGDILGDQATIEAARNNHSGLAGWNYVSGDLAKLEQLIDEVYEKPTPVKSMVVNLKLNKAMAAAGLLTVAVAGAGAFWWKDQQDKKQAVELARIRALALQQQTAPIVKPTNATNFPIPADLFAACVQKVDREISEYGWEIDKVSCTTTQATIYWERKDGATIEFRPEGNLSDDGMHVTQLIDLGLKQSSKDDRADIGQASQKLLAWAQAGNLKLTDNTPVVKSLPGSEAEAPKTGPEKHFTVTLGFSPFDLDLSGLPGLRIHEIQSKEKGQWDLKGVLYGS